MLRVITVALLSLALPALAAAAPWTLDPATTVGAWIEWQGRPIAVRFPGLTGQVEFDARQLERARATLTVPAAAATTGNAVVDAMMRGADYLDARAHPTITFELDRLTKTSADTADVTGRVTLRGVERAVTLKAKVVAFGPTEADPAVMTADFVITGAIDRRDFGSTAGAPELSTTLPLDIRLVMTGEPAGR
jgi:polyisoprenoid-binding protein YceI